jgi:hypothetical protein
MKTRHRDEASKNWGQHKVGRKGGKYSKSFYSPVKQVNTHVYRLSSYLKQQGAGGWVQGMVFFSNPQAEINVISQSTPVFDYQNGKNQMVSYIMDFIKQMLSEEQRRRIEDILLSSVHLAA